MKRVQFCCGGNKLAGFDNFYSDLDIRKSLPFSNEKYEFAFIEHGLEHFDCGEGLRFLEECHRILKPKGVLRVCVPVLDRIQNLAHMRDLVVGHGHRQIYNLSLLVTFLQLAGFETVSESERKDCDSHWTVIGQVKDDLETLRVEARKAT